MTTQKTWESAVGSRSAKVALDGGRIVLASNCGPGGTDVGAVITVPDFLEGQYQDVIRKMFGQEILDEMIAAAKKVDADPAQDVGAAG